MTDKLRPFVHPNPPRLDVDGAEWYAGDPYPTWYRWEGKSLVEPEWNKPIQWADGIKDITQTEEYLEWRKNDDRVREGASRRYAEGLG